MAIIFGISSIKLKSYTPEELGVKQQMPEGSIVELKNSYFHLFWIPFFPTSRKWTAVIAGKRFTLAGDIEKILYDRKYQKKSPIFLFAGTILLLGAVLFIGISNYLNKQKGRNYINRQREKEIKMIEQKITNADTTSYFVFMPKSEFDETHLLKVVLASDDSIYFARLVINTSARNFDSANIKPFIPSFEIGSDSVKASKELIKKSYQSIYSFLSGFEGVNIFSGEGKYQLQNIYQVNR